MSIIFTAAADADLDEIFAYTAENYPDQLLPLQSRIREVMAGIEAWPRNARPVEQRPGVRVVPLLKYPFRIFYRQMNNDIEILHIHHVARQLWE
jgi:plasmid stabilization system protein ParE